MSAFVAEWAAGTDDGDDLEYRWQLSATMDFSGAILVDGAVGGATVSRPHSAQSTASLLALESKQVERHGLPPRRRDGWTNFDASGDSQYAHARRRHVSPRELLPTDFALIGTAPNPARDIATLRVDLPRMADVTVEVYDIMGRCVLATPSATLGSGSNRTIALGVSGLASGTYLYRVHARMGDADGSAHRAADDRTLIYEVKLSPGGRFSRRRPAFYLSPTSLFGTVTHAQTVDELSLGVLS